MNTENEKVRPPTPQHGREKRRSSQASPASAKRPASPPLCSGFKPSTRQGISSLKRPSRAPNPLHRTEWKQVPATKTTTISPLGRPTGSPLNQSGPCPKPDIAPGKVRTRWVPWGGGMDATGAASVSHGTMHTQNRSISIRSYKLTKQSSRGAWWFSQLSILLFFF